jgi:signal transduction histidine kinase
MSLRVRLVLVIIALVTVLAFALSALNLDTLVNTLSDDALQRSELAKDQVQSFVTAQIRQHADEYAAPASMDEMKALWNQIVTSDEDISMMLVKTMAQTTGIVEINVAGQTGQVLASSNPTRVGGVLTSLQTFRNWKNKPLYRRVVDLIVRRPDYQVTVPLGIGDIPIFTIQVVTSSVLLRSALTPEVQWLALVSGSALLVSLILTATITNWVLRPLRRIEQTIDRIVQGSFRRDEQERGMAKEFAAVESKLNLLGEKFRGAREEATEKQHNIEALLERMASQLDVATRLAAISRVSGGVAHEIKNPLNAISLHLDLMRARLGGPEEELITEIEILSSEVRRLDRVVKTFLDFSRPVDVKLEKVNLAELVSEVAKLMTPQAELANVTLEFQALENDPAFINGDPDMLKQAVLNLVTNALDVMKNGGELRLRVSRVNDYVVLEVVDNGPGIPPELRDKVFQLYFTTKAKGSGIGLAMTYRAVQLHNGTIDFLSEDGRGTTFRLEFPVLA